MVLILLYNDDEPAMANYLPCVIIIHVAQT